MRPARRMRAVVTAAVGMSLLLIPLEASAATGWADPVPGFGGAKDWMEHGCGPTGTYSTGKVHMGSDFNATAGSSIRAIGDGRAVFSGRVGGIDEALHVRHVAADGRIFHAIYGHINAAAKFPEGVINVPVSANEVLGTVRAHPEETDHLHFGIWDALFYKQGSMGDRECAASEPPVSTANNRSFRSPVAYLNAHPGTYDDGSGGGDTGGGDTGGGDTGGGDTGGGGSGGGDTGGGSGGSGSTDTFIDDDGSIFEGAHEWMAFYGITRGCNPPTNNRYCGNNVVTRGQMAAFLNRALALEPDSVDRFDDDDSSIFERDIQALAAAGVTKGCNPPRNNRFCPNDPVTRGQMAAFLSRALSLPASSTDAFVDDNSSIFEAQIQALAAAGVTKGCNPPTNNRFCPDDPVTRSQMAAFMQRALG